MDQEEQCRKYVLPFCPNYHIDRQIFNRSIQKYPSVIIYCENEEDVKQAVRHAVDSGQTVHVRSGGHNYDGFCIGDNVVVIDTSHLKNISICEEKNTVKIGSGVSNSELYGFLSKYNFPFPSGTCPTVNAVGLTQGGGWGHSARMFGLACDLLIEAELVDAAGCLITVNAACNSDLYWALRGGGGGNFGVITSLTYSLPPKFVYVTYVDIQYHNINEATALQFFRTWQEWTKGDENRFTPNSRIFNSARDGMGIFLRGFFYGSPKEAKAAVEPFLRIRGARSSFEYTTFEEATQIDASVYPATEKFRFAGRFSNGNLSDSQMLTLIRLIRYRARGSNYCSVALYALGGKVREIQPCETAFFYRDSDYIVGIETVWRNPSAEYASLAWIQPRFEILQSFTIGSYINFPYLPTDNYMDAYYGGNAERLIKIKEEHDPCDLFRFPQSIRSVL